MLVQANAEYPKIVRYCATQKVGSRMVKAYGESHEDAMKRCILKMPSVGREIRPLKR